MILPLEKFSLKFGSENCPVKLALCLGNRSIAIDYTESPPLAPGAVAIKNNGLLKNNFRSIILKRS